MEVARHAMHLSELILRYANFFYAFWQRLTTILYQGPSNDADINIEVAGCFAPCRV